MTAIAKFEFLVPSLNATVNFVHLLLFYCFFCNSIDTLNAAELENLKSMFILFFCNSIDTLVYANFESIHFS
jgi:hypothetical protein